VSEKLVPLSSENGSAPSYGKPRVSGAEERAKKYFEEQGAPMLESRETEEGRELIEMAKP